MEKISGIFAIIGGVSVLVAIIGFILFFVIDLSTPFGFIVFLIVLCSIFSIIFFVFGSNIIDEKKNYYINIADNRANAELDKIKKGAEEFYNDFCLKNNLSDSSCIVEKRFICISDGKLHLTETLKSYLSMYTRVNDYSADGFIPVMHSAIPVSDIQYFAKEGDVQYTSKISGGGGGGSSISGAIIGGLIAGDAGAIIGSRQKIEEIKTETQTFDSRKTVIRFYKDSEIRSWTFDGFEVYNYLLKTIPEKDLITINLSNNSQNRNTESIAKIAAPETDIKKKLRDLKELHEDGLISDAEYESKRSELLSRI